MLASRQRPFGARLSSGGRGLSSLASQFSPCTQRCKIDPLPVRDWGYCLREEEMVEERASAMELSQDGTATAVTCKERARVVLIGALFPVPQQELLVACPCNFANPCEQPFLSQRCSVWQELRMCCGCLSPVKCVQWTSGAARSTARLCWKSNIFLLWEEEVFPSQKKSKEKNVVGWGKDRGISYQLWTEKSRLDLGNNHSTFYKQNKARLQKTTKLHSILNSFPLMQLLFFIPGSLLFPLCFSSTVGYRMRGFSQNTIVTFWAKINFNRPDHEKEAGFQQLA